MISCSFNARVSGDTEDHPLWVQGEDVQECQRKARNLLQSRFERRGRKPPDPDDIDLGTATIDPGK